MDANPKKPKPSVGAPPSKIPSWTTLGFLLGALFVLALEHRRNAEEYTAAPVAALEAPALMPAPAQAVPAPSAPPAAGARAAFAKSAAHEGPPTLLSGAPTLETVEGIFAVWGRHAVWKDDVTEVALWNSTTRSFSDCFEVMRAGDAYYFRSIPSLTRPILNHGVEVESPLQFTETEETRAEWLSEVRGESWRAFSAGARSSLSAPVPPGTAGTESPDPPSH